MVDSIKNSIQHKRSEVSGNKPNASQIAVGEIAINFADRSVYTKDKSGVIHELARDVWRSSSQPDSASEGDFWFNSSSKAMKLYDGTEWKDIYVDVTVIEDTLANLTTDSVAEGTTNLYYTEARVDANFATKTTSDLTEGSNLYYTTARFDSDFGENTTDDLTEGSTNLYYTDARADARVENRLSTLTSDSVAEGTNHLYYNDTRVDDRVDTLLDSDYLDGRMSIDNLSDVQINEPTLNDASVLSWNGSVWTNDTIQMDAAATFKGTINAVDSAAPAGPSNGDLYVNTASGTADASWTGLNLVDSGDGLLWDSDHDRWDKIGSVSSGAVIRVQAGSGIEVDETDASRPVVSINRTTVDGWYYTHAQVDSALDSEHSWNVSEHNALQAEIDTKFAYDSDVVQQQIDSSLENILTIDASPSGGVSDDF